MWPFRKRDDRYVKRRDFEELVDEVRSLQLRLRKLRARHLAEENAESHAENVDLKAQAEAVLRDQQEIASSIGLDRAALNRLTFKRKH